MSLQSPLEGMIDYRPSDRTRIILALAQLREEWQQATHGGSLLKLKPQSDYSWLLLRIGLS